MSSERKRFNYLISFAIVAVSFFCDQCIAQVDDQLSKPKNVLLVVFDDLNLDIGIYGHVDVKTPHLDAFARRSMKFNHAHCNGPYCAPSRTSFIYGLYPSSTGVFSGKLLYENKQYANAVSMFAHFKRNAYDVYGVGKLFHGNWDEGLVAAQFSESYRTPREKLPYAYFQGQRVRHPGNPRIRTVDKPNGSWGSLSNVPSAEKYGNGWEGWGPGFKFVSNKNRSKLPDEEATAWAAVRLNRKTDKPFFLSVGYVKPHTPLIAPQEFIDLYDPARLNMKAVLEDDLHDVVPTMQVESMYTDMWKRINAMPNSEEVWRDYYRAYLACISYADHQFGQLMGELEASGHFEDTIVIVTSDHGYHFGDKNRIGKGTPWNGTTHIPFLVRVPGMTTANSICNTPISLVDLYPTLNDLCGLSGLPHGSKIPLDGQSIKPMLQNPDEQWSGPSVAFNNCYEDTWTVCDQRYRYVLDCNGNEELYDFSVDPNEWNNLAKDGSHADKRAQMNAQMMSLSGGKKPQSKSNN